MFPSRPARDAAAADYYYADLPSQHSTSVV